jgi:hypothetical protein
MMMRSVTQKSGESGSALVEFAVVSVIVLTVLFGIVDMGRALFAYDWVSNAARIGTRYAMVRGTSCSTLLPGCETGADEGHNGARQADIVAYLDSQAIGINPNELTVWARCDVGAEVFGYLPCAPGQGIIVRVTYTFSFISPFTPRTWNMSSASVRTVSQ